MGTELQMLLCIGGIYTSYLAYGLLQEGIYKFEDSSGRKCVTAMPCSSQDLYGIMRDERIQPPGYTHSDFTLCTHVERSCVGQYSR